LRLLDADASRQLADWLALYKRWRERLHHGRVWLGECGDGVVWQAHGEDAAEGANDVLLFVYRTAPSTLRYMPLLQLPMLDRTANYRLKQIEPELTRGKQLYDTTTPWLQALRSEDGVVVNGAWLMESGLALPRAKAETAFVLHLQRI
jgi:alpha-galactosidase